MTANGWLQILAFAALVGALTVPLGAYLHRVFEGDRQPLPRLLGPIERFAYRFCGVDPAREQDWLTYTASLLVFSLFGLLATYALERLQGALPGNPQHLPGVPPALAWNTAASFATNTNWQAYTPETTVSDLTQMAGLAWQNFTSAAAGIAAALAVARGLTRRGGPEGPATLGNFWVDLVRATLYVLLPGAFVVALFLVSQGVLQTLAPYREVTTLEGARQLLALGPVASQEAIKMLGTNGGGFFNANSAHPFENPTPLSNLVELVAILAIPAALTYTFGRMAGDRRQGWALFAAMALLFAGGVVPAYWAEAHPEPALRGLPVTAAGALEGKETRFGIAESALFATVTTGTSCGAVNASLDSFTPLGGMVPLVNLLLGEVIFGGVGAGLYGILVFVLLAVFIAGLMVGRTPEYLGKKIEAKEVKLAMLYALLLPALVLGLAGWAIVARPGVSSLGNAGPHGLTEVLYAFASGAGNNGSAFAGLAADTPFWNVTLGLDMLAGRFLMMVPVLAIAGSMAGKKTVAPGLGTFPTHGALFVGLLVAVIVIVGALTFLPALSLGPVAEHFLALHGKLF